MSQPTPLDHYLAYFLYTVVGASLSTLGYRNFRKAQLIEDTPISKASSAAQGLVELQGYAWPAVEQMAPVAESAVVYYEFEILKLDQKNWISVVNKKSYAPFFLADSSGLVQIWPSRTEVEFSISNNREYPWESLSKQKRMAVSKLLDSFEKKGLVDEWGETSHKLLVREKFISNNSKLCAIGDFKNIVSNQDPSAKPLEGVAIFMNTLKKGFGSTQALADESVRVYGQIVARMDDSLYVADCWRDKVLNRLGGAIKSYLLIVSGGLIILGLNVVYVLEWLHTTNRWQP